MIRTVTQTDIMKIKALMQSEQGFWKQATRPDVIEIEVASAKDLAIVWEEEGEILGFACAHDLGFRAYLSALIVTKSARRKGIGRQLVEHIQIELRSRGCPVLFSDVWRNAEGFYRRLEWSEPDVTLLRTMLAPEATSGIGESANTRTTPGKRIGAGMRPFVLALAACALLIIIPWVLGTAYAIYLIEPTSGMLEDDVAMFLIIGLGFLGSVPFAIAAVVLGIKRLRQEHQKRTFPILGIVLGSLHVLLAVCSVLGGIGEWLEK